MTDRGTGKRALRVVNPRRTFLPGFVLRSLVVRALVLFALGFGARARGAPQLPEDVEQGRIEIEGTSLPYQLLRPASATASTPVPLVVFLHGAGERGDDNLAQFQHFPEVMAKEDFRRRYPCLLLAVQCPAGDRWAEFRRDRIGQDTEAPRPLRAVEQKVRELVEDPSVDPRRVYLTGLSMGGFGSFELAERHPEWFAAVAPICGGGDAARADRLVDLPMWVFHGRDDDVVPVELSRDMVRAIRRAGGTPRYTESEGMGHASWVPAYADGDLLDWMFRQRRPDPQDEARMAWWREARFGLFLHWGLYAIPAGAHGGRTDYGEWILESAQIPVAQYEAYRERFDPVDFDAKEWAALAAQAGMRYVVITSKHHDGFGLFDSKLTDWDVGATPFHRDVLAELAPAVRERGLKMCFYHSIMDWHHPDYLPRRRWEDRPAEGADFERYRTYLHGQVAELLTRYGDIGVMWFDGEWEPTWEHAHGLELYRLCRTLQPNVIVNNRVDKGRGGMAGMTAGPGFAGDFGTPEQEVPAEGLPGTDWESCVTMNDHWGYNAADRNFKSSGELLRLLVDVASKGGNLLLNIGPTAQGRFPPECIERLHDLGAWTSRHGEALYGTQASPLGALPFGRCTLRREGDRSILYLHLFEEPANGVIELDSLGNRPLGARWVGGGALEVARGEHGVRIVLADRPAGVEVPVVALEVEGAPVLYEAPRIDAASDGLVDVLDVTLTVRSPSLDLRYTLDGSEPTLDSSEYLAPFRIRQAGTVRARAFHAGEPVSPITERRFETFVPRPAVAGPEHPESGLRRSTHRGSFDTVADLVASPVTEVDTVTELGLPSGPSREYEGYCFDAWFEILADGLYTFALTSDDGSQFLVDGEVVVDADGLHGAQTFEGTVALAEGLHRAELRYFNKTGGAELELRARRAVRGNPVRLQWILAGEGR